MLVGQNFGNSTLWVMSVSFSATHFMQHSKSRKMYLLFWMWSVVCGWTKIWSFSTLSDTHSLSDTNFMQHSKSRKMYLLFRVWSVVCLQTKIWSFNTLCDSLSLRATHFMLHSKSRKIFLLFGVLSIVYGPPKMSNNNVGWPDWSGVFCKTYLVGGGYQGSLWPKITIFERLNGGYLWLGSGIVCCGQMT